MRFAPKIPYLTNISSPLFDPNKTKKIFKNDAAEFRLYTALAGIFFFHFKLSRAEFGMLVHLC